MRKQRLAFVNVLLEDELLAAACAFDVIAEFGIGRLGRIGNRIEIILPMEVREHAHLHGLRRIHLRPIGRTNFIPHQARFSAVIRRLARSDNGRVVAENRIDDGRQRRLIVFARRQFFGIFLPEAIEDDGVGLSAGRDFQRRIKDLENRRARRGADECNVDVARCPRSERDVRSSAAGDFEVTRAGDGDRVDRNRPCRWCWSDEDRRSHG